MRIIIVGCGRVGAGLATQLSADGHDVIVLDERTEAFRRLPPDFPGQALRGDGTDESVLRRAGADGADWFLALTNGDNRNILAAQLAALTFGIGNVICKVNGFSGGAFVQLPCFVCSGKVPSRSRSSRAERCTLRPDSSKSDSSSGSGRVLRNGTP